MSGQTPNELLTTAEVAAILKCHKNHLEQLRVKGGGPEFVKLGPGTVRYRRGAIDAWIDARTRRSTSEAA